MKLTPHPDYAKILARLRALGRSRDVALEADVYRFINPRYAKAVDIISGEGALHAAGRWNARGMGRLSYTAMSPETALAEALSTVHYFGLPMAQALPRVLVALRLKVRHVLDLREGKVRSALRLSEQAMRALDWRAENQRGTEALTQAWGQAFAAAHFEAVIVPSAPQAHGVNVLVFPDNLRNDSDYHVLSEVVW